jgi:hypothetical protein
MPLIASIGYLDSGQPSEKISGYYARALITVASQAPKWFPGDELYSTHADICGQFLKTGRIGYMVLHPRLDTEYCLREYSPRATMSRIGGREVLGASGWAARRLADYY